MAPSFPAFLRIEDRRVLVVGGGPVAWQKARQLSECGAFVRMVALHFSAEAEAPVPAERIEREERAFQPDDLNGCVLAVAATRDPAAQEAVVNAARARGVLCNVVDVPELCDFTYGAVARRGSLQIAVTTDGKFPILAQRIRDAIAADWPDAVAPVLDALSEARRSLRRESGSFEENRARLGHLLNEVGLETIRNGDTETALERIERWTSSRTR